MKTLKKLSFAALVAALLLPASALMAQPPVAPGDQEGGFGDGPGRGPAGDRGSLFREFLFERMAETLELSEGQQAEVEALRVGHREEIEPMIEKARAARHAVGDLMRAYAFDEETVRKAARQAADTEVELMVTRARHHNELRSVLTPEQQEKAAQLREGWQERRQAFRGGPGRGPGQGPRGGFGRERRRW